MYYEYRIVKIEKGLFLIEYKTAPYGVWHEVKDKKFKTKPKAEAWARRTLFNKVKRMDKLEYIPGDIVKIEYGEATGKIGFVTNTFLRRKGCYSLVVFIGKGFQGSSKDDWIQTYNDEVSPIPLTPEILKKNGWEKLYEKFFEKNVNNIRLTIELSENIYVAINRIFIMEIHYIHELQHLLFGLGINHEMEV